MDDIEEEGEVVEEEEEEEEEEAEEEEFWTKTTMILRRCGVKKSKTSAISLKTPAKTNVGPKD